MTEKEYTYLTDLSQKRLSEIENEIHGDIKEYFKNCSENYLEYVTAAQKLYPDVYAQMEKYDSEFDLSHYLSKIDRVRKRKDLAGEIELLKEGVDNNIYTPATYSSLAVKLEKNGHLEKALDICLKWFETDYWKLPNTWKGSLQILDRLEKLEKKYGAQHNL